MKCSLGISNFLKEISSLSWSIVFLYFFASFTYEDFLISLFHSLELCIQLGISLPLSFIFRFSSFLSSLYGLFRQPLCFLAFLFLRYTFGHHFCTMLWTSVLNSSGTLSTRSSPLNLFVTSTVYSKGIWFRSYLKGLMVFPTFFNLSLNFTIRKWWSEPQSAPSLVFLTVWSFSIFGCKEYNQSDFGIDHLVMSMCRVFSCVVGRGCLLWPVRSLGKTLWAFALLHFVLQGQSCLLLQVSLDFLPFHSVSYNEKDIFFVY